MVLWIRKGEEYVSLVFVRRDKRAGRISYEYVKVPPKVERSVIRRYAREGWVLKMRKRRVKR